MSANINKIINTLRNFQVDEPDQMLSFEDRGLKLDTAIDSIPVVEEIEKHTSCTTLIFKGNTINIPAAEKIANVLTKCKNLRRALWSDMFTGRSKAESPPALKMMCNALITAQVRLTELDLSDNAFGPAGADSIREFLRSPGAYTLKVLKLNNDGLGITGGRVISESLIFCHQESSKAGQPLRLTTFVAGRNRLENDGATALANAFKVIGSLEEIILPQNGIHVIGISALADAFSSNANLKRISLEDNTMTLQGVKALCKALPHLKLLQWLNIGDCLIKNQGTSLLAKTLKNCCDKLEELHVYSNEITASSALDLAQVCIQKKTLKTVDFGANFLGQKGFEDLTSLFKASNVSYKLALSEDDLGEPSEEEFEEVTESAGEEELVEDLKEKVNDEEYNDEEDEEAWLTVDHFLEEFDEQSLCELGDGASDMIMQRIFEYLEDPYYTIYLLFEISQLISENCRPNVYRLCMEICHAIIAYPKHDMFTSILCQKLGLIKSEDGTYLKPRSLYGILQVLKAECKEEYFVTSFDVIKYFAQRHLKQEDSQNKLLWLEFIQPVV